MLEMLRSNDAVLLSYAEAVLRQVGIVSLLADPHISAIAGSIGAFPRRLLVGAGDGALARSLLRQAGLADWLVGDGGGA